MEFLYEAREDLDPGIIELKSNKDIDVCYKQASLRWGRGTSAILKDHWSGHISNWQNTHTHTHPIDASSLTANNQTQFWYVRN